MTKPVNPSIDEVVAYFFQCGIKNRMVAEKWYHDNNAIGWMRGKYKIVNWQSAASADILRTIESFPDKISSTSTTNNLFESEDMKEALRKYEGK